MMFSDLPLELESEILSRVPATYLKQLRSTCKRWYTLFNDPMFIKKNMLRATTHVILKMKYNVYSVSINLDNPSIKFMGKLKSLKDPQCLYISVISHCDGLLLCIMRGNNGHVVVCNPCTGQTRKIPQSPSSNRDTAYEYVLGYDNNKSCNNYKILKISSYFTPNKYDPRNVLELEIYEFSCDSWRVVEGVTYKGMIRSCQVSLKGNSYWVAWNNIEYPNNRFLLMFDFKKERFENLSLPSECDKYVKSRVVLSVVGQDKLSVLLERLSLVSLEIKIWVTDTKFDEAIQYSLVVETGKIMRPFLSKCVDSFLLDEENKRAVCFHRDNTNTIVYTVGDQDSNIQVCKQVHADTSQVSDKYWPRLLSYVPSLVQISK